MLRRWPLSTPAVACIIAFMALHTLGGLLEGPQYTRPFTFRGEAVPDILISGHHANVDRWRREQALLRTLTQRPDLLTGAELSKKDRLFLAAQGWPPPE